MLKDLEKRKHGNVWHPKPPLTHSHAHSELTCSAHSLPSLSNEHGHDATGPSHASELVAPIPSNTGMQAAKVACRCGCQDYSLGNRNKFLSSVHAMSC